MLIIIAGAVINILSIIVMSIGLFHEFKNPKHKAIFGYTITAIMIMYMILLGIISIYALFVNHNLLYSLILFLCVISPFIIGKFVKYETLKKYTATQIMCYVVSLTTLLLNF